MPFEGIFDDLYAEIIMNLVNMREVNELKMVNKRLFDYLENVNLTRKPKRLYYKLLFLQHFEDYNYNYRAKIYSFFNESTHRRIHGSSGPRAGFVSHLPTKDTAWRRSG